MVYAVIIGRPPSGDLSPASVSYTCGFYNIPVIGVSSRDSALSDKLLYKPGYLEKRVCCGQNLHGSFLRTVPPFSHQADVWVRLMAHFQFRCVVLIHSADNDGRFTAGRFQTLAVDHNIKLEATIEYEPGLTDIYQQLETVRNFLCRVYILNTNTEDAEAIFREVRLLNMTEQSFVWLVSEQAMKASNRPDGILGLQLVDGTNEAAHIADSVQLVGQALRALVKAGNITPAPSDCSQMDRVWDTGLHFARLLKQQTFFGKSGRVSFDDKGDRVDSNYEIVNINGTQLVTVGMYEYSQDKEVMELIIHEEEIAWPGKPTIRPQGYIVPTHLKVVTIAEKPFVWIREVNHPSLCGPEEIPCPRYNSSLNMEHQYCCRGYCMDLLRSLSSELNFTYTLYQVEDGQYGAFDYMARICDHYRETKRSPGDVQVNNSDKKVWTGMVGDLVNEKADMIVAPLTINPERSQAIEFSKPFKYQGITILEKKHPKTSTLASFLQPFQKTLWFLVMVSVHVVALALYLLDRFSPFGRYKLPNSDTTEEDALNLSSAIWFAWGVLLNSGIGEGTPRSFSARVLGMVWAGFAMIVVASYTANLAAFLVLDRPETSLTGINDARLRNPMENFTYATVKGSAVDMYFRRQVELSNMYRTMEGKNYDHTEDAILAVKSGELNAFIWDSSRLEYEAAQDCDLSTAGEQFGRSGYGIGLKKHSFYADRVTLELLRMHESGHMELLDNKWILHGGDKCDNKNEKFPATLGLKNMAAADVGAGVFILVGAGIVGGIGLIIIEIMYKKHQTKKQKSMEAARHAADRWRGTVGKRKERLNAPPRNKSNGMEAFTVEREGIPPPPPPPVASPAVVRLRPRLGPLQRDAPV
ncbi:GRIN1 [Cordylochernes scorpioides]|uniref:Glutamate [NMDA] receptor subunit 1 n=1 Tax=Cordylochernes scorpioides TaxID=51811 RepID=A0ABY6L9M1_9ARAC|nr:GRIN1 [Cordylochernes scorpioides]